MGKMRKMLLQALVSTLFCLVSSINGEELHAANPGKQEQKQAENIRPAFQPPKLSDYKLEGVLFLGILLYFVVFIVGLNENKTRGIRVAAKIEKVLIDQFSTAGVQGIDFSWISYSELMFTAYGRRNVEYVRGYIKLRPRQDLVYYLKNIINGVTTMNFNKQDEVEGEIELSFGLDKNDLQGTVMAIYPKTQSKKIKDARYDIELFCEKTVKVGKGLELAVEHMEIRDRLQELGFIKFMEAEEQEGNGKSGCSITEVTLSDQPPIRPKKMQDLNTNIKILTAKIKIDTSVTEPGFGRATYERGSDSDKQKDGIYEKVEALCYLSDYMARKLSETLTKQISEKMRTKRQQAYRDIVAKHQEEVSLAKKKMKQAQVDNISDESQRIKAQSKLDSKEEQRRKKKQQKKYVVT